MSKHDLFLTLIVTTVVAMVVIGTLFHLAEKEASKRHSKEPDHSFEWRVIVAVFAVAGTIVLVTR